MLLASFTALLLSKSSIVSRLSSVLVTGPHGCGKTTMIRSVAKQVGIQAIACDSTWVCGLAAIDFVGALDEVKRKASRLEAAVIVFDNLDLLFPADDFHVDVRALLTMCSLLEHCPANCIIIGVSVSSDSLNPVSTSVISLLTATVYSRCVFL